MWVSVSNSGVRWPANQTLTARSARTSALSLSTWVIVSPTAIRARYRTRPPAKSRTADPRVSGAASARPLAVRSEDALMAGMWQHLGDRASRAQHHPDVYPRP